MTQNNTARKGLAAFVWGNFRLQANDFWQTALCTAVFWLLGLLGMAVAAAVSGDPALLRLGVPGVVGVVAAELIALITAMSRIWLEFKMGVQMSAPRRRMLAASAALSFATTLCMLATAWLLDRLWLAWAGGRFGADAEDLLQGIPLWGWLALLVLPTLSGMVGGAVILRFGRRGGWTLYALFMIVCLAPNVLNERFPGWAKTPDGLLDRLLEAAPWLLEAAPWLLAGLAAAEAVALLALLRRVSIGD